MGTGLDEKTRGEFLEKMVRLRENKQSAKAESCKNSSTPNEKTDKKIGWKLLVKVKSNIIIKDINITTARECGGKSRKREIWMKKWIQ